MRAIEFANGGARFTGDAPEPRAAAGECRVRVVHAGICSTDLALLRGYMGFSGIPGHEFVGVALDGPLEGLPVVGDINAGCGQCDSCLRDGSRHCPGRTVLGILGRSGAFAERLALPARNLHPVPPRVPLLAAVFAEPLAAALRVLDDLQPGTHSRVLVLGDGRLGLLIAMVLRDAGFEAEVCGRHPGRRRFLPAETPFWEAGSGDLDRRAPFDAAVEATGSASVLARAVELVRPGGTVILKTTTESPHVLDLAPLVVREIRLVGSRCGSLPRALDLLATGRIDPAPLIEASFPLEMGLEALDRAARGSILKIILSPSG